MTAHTVSATKSVDHDSLVETLWGGRAIAGGLVGIGAFVLWALPAANLLV